MWHTDFGDFVPGQGNFAHITFDLGATYDIDAINVWNYGETHHGGTGFTRRGVRVMSVSVASSGNSSTFTSIGNFTLARASVKNGFFAAETLAVSAEKVRFVRFDILRSHWNRDNDVVGLSEVAFSGTTVSTVPEPSSLVMLALGMGAGLFRVRRKPC